MLNLLQTILLPPLVALILCVHFGYAWGRHWLPGQLVAYRWLLTPLLGGALWALGTAAFATTTALTPPQITAGMAVLAIPLNLLAWRRPTRAQLPAILPPEAHARLAAWLVLALAVGSFVLTILPLFVWGVSTPIGSNWDPADVYVPLGRALQERSQRDIDNFPRNPLVRVMSTPPVVGRIHGFSYLHSAASSATNVDPLHSFIPLLGLMLAFVAPATYVFGRSTSLRAAWATVATALTMCAWLPLWVAYNGSAEHLHGIPFLPLALATLLIALSAGGWRALGTAALMAAALATIYYPAMSLYVAMGLPMACYLLWRALRDEQRSWWLLLARGAAVAVGALILSLPAQGLMFFTNGYLPEILKYNSGFVMSKFVPLASSLGIGATFHGEQLGLPIVLTYAAVAIVLLLWLAAIVSRRQPFILAMAIGAACYLGYLAAIRFHYGFYKGISFTIPLIGLLTAAGASSVWDFIGARQTRIGQGMRAALAGGIALLLVLNAATIWRLQASYAMRGPQLWSLEHLAVAGLDQAVPPSASVLIVPSEAHPRTFYSLVSYALLGRELFGHFPTAYASLSAGTDRKLPEFVLLPDGIDPATRGYDSTDLRWSSAGMRLYGRAAQVRYHRGFVTSGRAPTLAPGEAMMLRLGAQRIALPDEGAPQASDPETAQLALAVASFAPTTLELTTGEARTNIELPGGIVEVVSPPTMVPGEVQLHNRGNAPAYLWWSELREPDAPARERQPTDVFLQVEPAPLSDPATVMADLRLRTQPLASGSQKLTALLVVSHGEQGAAWREIGQRVFFPQSGDLQISANLHDLSMAVTQAGAPIDLIGDAAPAGDGKYRITLLLANNGEIVYGTTIWSWRQQGDTIEQLYSEGVAFDVVPLPHATTPLDQQAADGALVLRGYSLPAPNAKAGAPLGTHLVWQSLRKIPAAFQARLMLQDDTGTILAEQIQPIGNAQHGTNTWQEGELAQQEFQLALPSDLSSEQGTLVVELLDDQGLPVPFADGAPNVRLATVRIAH